MAAPTVNNVDQRNFSDSTSFSYDAGTGSGRVLVVVIGTNDATDRVTAITYNGVSLTQGARQVGDVSVASDIWYLENPASGSNTLALTTNGSEDYSAITARIEDAESVISAIGNTGTKKGDSTTPNVDITPTASGNLLIGGLVSDDGTAFTPDSGITEHGDIANTIRTGMFSKESVGTSAENIGATAENDDWAAAALEIKAPSDQPPGAPTLETADDNETTDTTPSLDFNAVDGNGDDVVYQVQIDTVTSFDSQAGSPLVDADGDVSTTGFENVDTPADTSPFNSGDTVRYTVQGGDELTRGTYYWRVRSKDPNGSDTWGDWSGTRAFHIYKTDREISSVALETLPTNVNHPYSDGATAFSDAGYNEFDDDDAGRISVVGGSATKPYFLQKVDLGNSGFTVSANVQVDKAAVSGTIGLITDVDITGQSDFITDDYSQSVNSGVTGTDRILVLTISCGTTSSANPTSITYNGVSLTKAVGLSRDDFSIWYLVNPATGSNTLDIQFNGGNQYFVANAAIFENVDQSSPIDATATDSASVGAGSDKTTNITTTVDDAMLVDVIGGSASGTDWDAVAGQTQLQQASNTWTYGAMSYKAAGTAGSKSMAYTNNAISSRTGYHVIVALNPNTVTPSIKLDLWNDTTGAWVNQDEETAPTADTDFDLTADKSTGFADFVDSNGWVVARVVADYIPDVTLRVDQFTITSAGTDVSITKNLEYAIQTETSITKSLAYEIATDNAVTKSLAYRVVTETAITKSMEYAIADSNAITKSLQYAVTTESSITKSLAYEIATTDSITKSLAYSVATETAITKGLEYAIVTDSSVTKGLEYAVQTESSITKSLEYSIADTGSITKSLAYRIVTDSVIQKSLAYAISPATEITKSMEYAVVTETAITKSMEYVIDQSNKITKSLQYTIPTTQTITKSMEYAIGGAPVVIQKSLEYTVSPITAIQKSLQYSIIDSTAITKSLAYGIVTESTIQKSMSYEIAVETAITKALSYKIVTDSVIQLSLAYTISIADQQITKQMEYRVSTSSSISKSLAYEIQTSTDITKSLAYSLVTETAIQKSMSYEIVTSTAITKALQYAIETDSLIQKSLAYRIGKTTTIQKSLQYKVSFSGTLNIEKDLKYAIETTNAIQLGLRYRVLSSEWYDRNEPTEPTDNDPDWYDRNEPTAPTKGSGNWYTRNNKSIGEQL